MDKLLIVVWRRGEGGGKVFPEFRAQLSAAVSPSTLIIMCELVEIQSKCNDMVCMLVLRSYQNTQQHAE